LAFVGDWVDSLQEDSVQGILSRKVNGLSGEVSEDICPVASPKGSNSLFSHASLEAVDDA